MIPYLFPFSFLVDKLSHPLSWALLLSVTKIIGSILTSVVMANLSFIWNAASVQNIWVLGLHYRNTDFRMQVHTHTHTYAKKKDLMNDVSSMAPWVAISVVWPTTFHLWINLIMSNIPKPLFYLYFTLCQMLHCVLSHIFLFSFFENLATFFDFSLFLTTVLKNRPNHWFTDPLNACVLYEFIMINCKI